MPDKRPDRLGPFLARITRNFALTKIVRRTAKKRGGGETALALEELDECLSSDYDLEKEIEDRELSLLLVYGVCQGDLGKIRLFRKQGQNHALPQGASCFGTLKTNIFEKLNATSRVRTIQA